MIIILEGCRNLLKGQLKNNVLIGAGANLLGEIGEHSIIGAGSVVTKSVPSYKVVMGIPGKIVKDLLTE